LKKNHYQLAIADRSLPDGKRDRYQPPTQFRGTERIISATFPELILTAARVFASADG
jgi:Uma2 family endonuclease